MSHETEAFIKYIYNGIKVYNDTDKKIIQNAKVPQLVDFEAKEQKVNGPDFLFDLGDIIFVVEHFEYDATKYKKRKGNQNRREIARVEREFQAFVEANFEEEILKKHDELKCEFNVINLVDNFLRSFKKHYANVEEYINNVLSCGKEIKEEDIRMVFFMEDTTPLGSYYLDNEGQPIPFSIFQVKELKEYLSKAVDIDYYFNGITCFSNNEMFMVSRENLNNGDINKLYEIDFSETKYFTFDEPQVISTQIKVSEEDMNISE